MKITTLRAHLLSIPLPRPWATICHWPSGASSGATQPQAAWPSGPAFAKPSISAASTRPSGRFSQTLMSSSR